MKIVKSSLHVEAADRIREMIGSGRLAPGARIPERELCELFGISRTPLREALKVLASEGLVEITPNRGARVVKLDRADIEAMFEVMGALEALAGELACRNIGRGDLAEIRALHFEMIVHYERGELERYFELNRRIHEALVRASRNPVLAQVYEGLASRVQRARYLANMNAERWAQAVGEHEHMLEALTARDGERLSRLLRTHLDNKLRVVCESDLVAPAGAATQERASA